MIVCGFLLSLYVARRRGRRMGIAPDDIFDGIIAALIGGIVGARILYVLYDWPFFRANPIKIIRLDEGGLVFYGGVLGGVLAVLIVLYRKGLPVRRTFDVMASVVPLGHALGRVGCFLNGCCFGRTTSSWVGIAFPRVLEPGNVENPLLDVGGQHIVGSPAFLHQLQQVPALVGKAAERAVPVHPTQLYAVGYNLVIFFLLSLWLRRRWRDGEIGWLYLVFYGLARFVNEVYRVTPPLLWGLSAAQTMCVPLVLLGLVMFLRGRKRPHQPLPAPWEPPPQASAAQNAGCGRENPPV